MLGWRRISAAYIGPNPFHECRTVSWQMSIPRSNYRPSTFRKLRGKRTYIITTRRMTSGDELKYRNGLAGFLSLDINPPHPHHLNRQSGAFALTGPKWQLVPVDGFGS